MNRRTEARIKSLGALVGVVAAVFALNLLEAWIGPVVWIAVGLVCFGAFALIWVFSPEDLL